LDRELTNAYETFLFDRRFDDEHSPDVRGRRYHIWQENSRHRGMVRGFYLSDNSNGSEPTLYEWDTERETFNSIAWPEQFAELRVNEAGRSPLNRSIPALVAPRFCRVDVPERNLEGPRPIGTICGLAFAVLDEAYIAREMLPSAIERHLGADYVAQVIHEGPNATTVFSTSEDRITEPDLSTPLLEMHPEMFRRGFMRRGGPPPPPPQQIILRPPRPEPGWRPGGPEPGLWTLRVKHRSGSLASAVNRSRRLNLGVSGAIIAILAGCCVLLFRSSSRERRLAQLQMDFVAGVSHELRTPLAATKALSENLADGLVHQDEQVRYYGGLLRDQVHGLSEMVEQVLRIAGIQSDRAQFQFQSVPVPELLERAVEAAEPEIEQSHCRLESDIDPSLPPVNADPASLSHCIRNLLSNAAKYGGEKGNIRLSAYLGPNSFHNQVWISVEDNGPGIERSELRHVFEPFYRGQRAIAEQIHGMGLGLALVKRIMDAHSGAVEVDSSPGAGCRFTLRVPVAQTGDS
jgi:signal transduction histidine kinase